MIKSFSSWNSVSEAIATGKQVMTDPATGKTHKLVYRVQSKSKFIIKIVNDVDVIDASNKLTPSGIQNLTNYLNSEAPFTSVVGQITPEFFNKYFIVYKVIADGELFGRIRQKIQFIITDRFDATGKPLHPNIPATITFIDSASFASLSQLSPAILQQINLNIQEALPDPDPNPEQTDDATKKESPEQTGKPEETQSIVGKKLLYTMRANSKIYTVTFIKDTEVDAKTKDGSDPNGKISKSGDAIFWDTNLDTASRDTAVSKKAGATLFTDGQFTNSYDINFFTKLFTDPAFRDNVIKEYEEEYAASDINLQNIRNMLYYKDGGGIFTQAVQAVSSTGSATPVGLSKDDQAAFAAALSSVNKA